MAQSKFLLIIHPFTAFTCLILSPSPFLQMSCLTQIASPRYHVEPWMLPTLLHLKPSFLETEGPVLRSPSVGTSECEPHVGGAHGCRCSSGFALPLLRAAEESASSPVTSLCGSVPRILIYCVFIFIFSWKFFLFSLVISALIQWFLRSILFNFQIFVEFVAIFNLG